MLHIIKINFHRMGQGRRTKKEVYTLMGWTGADDGGKPSPVNRCDMPNRR